MNTPSAIGLVLSVVGGTLELVGIVIVAVSVLRVFRWADNRVKILRTTASEYQRTINGLADNDSPGHKAANDELTRVRKVAGVEPDTTWDDVSYLRTWITHSIAANGRTGLWATAGLIGLGVFLSAAGSVVSAFG